MMTDMVEAIADKLLEDHMALLAENAALRTELAAAESLRAKQLEFYVSAVVDAKRYRWLCEGMIIPKPSLWDSGIGFVRNICALTASGRIDKSELDAAIDAAIAKENKNAE